MATAPDSMGVKDLKAELEQYGVDYSACVEKKDLVKLLTKTRTERGYPPTKASASTTSTGNSTPAAAASSTSSGGGGASTPSTGSKPNSRASSTSGDGGAATATPTRLTPSAAALPKKLRVAVVFDPDNEDVRDCSQFIQPFFMNTPEAEGRDLRIAWVMPAALRDDLIRFNLPDQLAHFAWFQALFVERDGQITDFDSVAVKGLEKELPGDASLSRGNLFARVAARWGADWIAVRRAGGVLGRMWLSSFASALKAGYHAGYIPGVLLLELPWHRKTVVGGADSNGPLVPATLQPAGAWYYWLTEVYPATMVYKLDEPEERDSDADKVMLACDEQAFAEARERLAQLGK